MISVEKGTSFHLIRQFSDHQDGGNRFVRDMTSTKLLLISLIIFNTVLTT